MYSYRPRKNPVAFLILALGLVTVACGRDKKDSARDSIRVAMPAVSDKPAGSVNTGWNENAAGPFMILSAADDGITAALVLPNETDSALVKTRTFSVDAFANASVDVFDMAGAAGSSRVAVNSQPQSAEGCLVWPAVRLVTKPRNSWTVGFAAGYAKPIQVDSVEKLEPDDSLSITTELVRQASTLSTNEDPAFRGLPFFVRKAYRLSIGDTTVLIGRVIRKINEEANPREEHLLLILERIGSPGAPFIVSYQSRSAGPEDAVRTTVILAAVRFAKTNRPAIVISFEYDDGGQIALLERTTSHSWKVTWRSAYTGC